MKKSTRAIVLALLGLLVCVGLFLCVGVLYFTMRGPLRALNPTTSLPSVTNPLSAVNNSPLVGKWLCNDCGGRIGVSILREYLADGTWTGHVTDASGNTYDYHGTYSLLGNNQYSEVDLSDTQNPAPQAAVYRFSITGDTLNLSVAEGETLTAEFQRVK
jgi:hypothetical protein